MLSDIFFSLAEKAAAGNTLALQLWVEIKMHYKEPSRQYHTLQHLENLYAELECCRSMIGDEDSLWYALFYHDIIYDTARQDNEEQSAMLALNRLEQLGVGKATRERCYRQILATKSHTLSEDPDTNLFTDADLSILGKPEPQYSAYSRQIRQEYHIYPDALYRPGRARLLQHFLDSPYLYKTGYFRDLYETQARRNITRELKLLLAEL